MNRTGRTYGLRDSEMTIHVLESYIVDVDWRHRVLLLTVDAFSSEPGLAGTESIAHEPRGAGDWDAAYEEIGSLVFTTSVE